MKIERLYAGFIEKARKHGAYTAFDLIKLVAIFNMTVDHVGLYFFPHDMWWRAVGRITFPVWFFLVGYSRSMSLKSNLWIYASVLLADHIFVGRSIFPVNALFSVIFSRVVVDACLRYGLIPMRLPEVMTAFFMLILFTDPLFEYGTLAFMFAVFGWMVREKEEKYFNMVLVTSYVSFVGWQMIAFDFNLLQSVYVILGTAWVVKWLAKPHYTILWPQWENSAFRTVIVVLSRNTLFYYFVHRLFLEILSNVAGGKGFGIIIKWFI